MQFHKIVWMKESPQRADTSAECAIHRHLRMLEVLSCLAPAKHLDAQRDRPYSAAQGDKREPHSKSILNFETALSAFSGIPVIPPLLFHIINLDQKIERRQEPIGGITKQPLMTGVVAEKSLTLLCRHGN